MQVERVITIKLNEEERQLLREADDIINEIYHTIDSCDKIKEYSESELGEVCNILYSFSQADILTT